jgi:hypothetical protein
LLGVLLYQAGSDSGFKDCEHYRVIQVFNGLLWLK